MIGLKKYITLIFSFLCITVYAQRFNISGRVIDANNEPLEFVSVRIAGTINGILTNEKGDYSINSASKDTVDIVFSYIGYRTETRKLVAPEGNLKFNMRLYHKDRSLDEVSVSEFRKQTSTLE
ncbi:MAG: carboxypeptidase-like regulatory domain-containing protein, partial [Bacteroidales bacterium]